MFNAFSSIRADAVRIETTSSSAAARVLMMGFSTDLLPLACVDARIRDPVGVRKNMAKSEI
jgi:hypothetical protein